MVGASAYTVNGVPLTMIPVTRVVAIGALLVQCLHVKAALDTLLLRIPLATAADTASFLAALAAIVAATPTDAQARDVEAEAVAAEVIAEAAAAETAANGTYMAAWRFLHSSMCNFLVARADVVDGFIAWFVCRECSSGCQCTFPCAISGCHRHRIHASQARTGVVSCRYKCSQVFVRRVVYTYVLAFAFACARIVCAHVCVRYGGRVSNAGLNTAHSSLDSIFTGRACAKAVTAVLIDIKALSKKVAVACICLLGACARSFERFLATVHRLLMGMSILCACMCPFGMCVCMYVCMCPFGMCMCV
jgi:hypothetical protein